MSDMSRPSTPLPAADHERHDALLVAQLSAGDPLTQAEFAEAQRLVTSCGACAALAADLRVVSMAVAREPVPSRRRDFRLSPQQAEQLSGNALTRFLRGLALPRARAFQPAAAGLLSVGLVFVVAGYAWPEGGSVPAQPESFAAPAPREQPAAEALPSSPPPALAEEPGFADVPETLEQTLRSTIDPGFFERLDEHQAGRSANTSRKSVAAEEQESEADSLADLRSEVGASAAGAAEAEAFAPEAPEAPVVDGAAEAPEALVVDGAADADAEPDPTLGGEDAPAADDVVGMTLDEDTAEAAPAVVATDDDVTAVAPDEASAEAVVPADDDGLERLLVLVGLILAIGGGGLLLLGWLARRGSDPLLR